MATQSAGKRLKNALVEESPLQLVGAINAYSALLAEHAGFKALYLSGAGVANASFGLPDLGFTTLDNVVEDVRRITSITELPLLVDADTGFDDPAETVERFIAAGAAGLHIEDQVEQKRCGHRPNKQLVSTEEMLGRLCTANAARSDKQFVIMARTDAYAVEGVDAAIDRMQRYVDAGADMIFAEAMTSLEQYKQITTAVNVPVLANITEFGKTPLFDLQELNDAGIAIALYPLTAFRAMSKAAQDTYNKLRETGTQKQLLNQMQTRDDLYQHLDYHRYEQQIDKERDDDR
ncbi:methylisocitrate lyase [Pseudomonadota bacterium]